MEALLSPQRLADILSEQGTRISVREVRQLMRSGEIETIPRRVTRNGRHYLYTTASAVERWQQRRQSRSLSTGEPKRLQTFEERYSNH